jgi:hypothetical protein
MSNPMRFESLIPNDDGDDVEVIAVLASDYDALAAELALSRTDRGSLFARLCETEAELAATQARLAEAIALLRDAPDDTPDGKGFARRVEEFAATAGSADAAPKCDCIFGIPKREGCPIHDPRPAVTVTGAP